MKLPGIIRRIDDLGRIEIPKEIRRAMKIIDGAAFEILPDEDGIYLKRVNISVAEALSKMADDLHSGNQFEKSIVSELLKCAETIRQL